MPTVDGAARDSPRAWRVVAGGFLATFTLFGIVYSFGAFFHPMAAEFGANRQATSTIFSITAFIYFLLGPLTGHFSDRWGPRPIVACGALATGAGLVATASVRRLSMAYVTYGLGVGIGVACGYVPLVAAISGWFLTKRNTALGVAVSGIGAGTLTVPPLAAALIKHFGWREAYLELGIAAAICLGLCAILASRPPAAANPTTVPLSQNLRSPNFALLYCAGMLWTIATAIPFVFLIPYAEARGIGQISAAALVSLIGLASTAGRLGLGVLADRTGYSAALPSLHPGARREFRYLADGGRIVLHACGFRPRDGRDLWRGGNFDSGSSRNPVRNSGPWCNARDTVHEQRLRHAARAAALRGDR